MVRRRREIGGAVDDGEVDFRSAAGMETFAIMDGLPAGGGVAGNVSAEETGRAGQLIQARGSKGLAKDARAADADVSLEAEWFVLAGEIISSGFLA